MKIAVVGTGYVGLVLGGVLAETGNDVICVDNDVAKVRMLRRAKVPIYEPGLTELVRRNAAEGRLTFTPQLLSRRPSVANRVHRGGHASGRGRSADLQHVMGGRSRDWPDDGRL